MDMKAVILSLVSILSIDADSVFNAAKAKIIPKSYFDVPLDTHTIEVLTNVRSLMRCAAFCERHIICRTADYNTTTQVCRLFETVVTSGTLRTDPTTSVIGFNYCTNDQQVEPQYICTRSGSYTVQQMFNKIALTPNNTLPSVNRTSYPNIQGIYTGSYGGELAFYTYTGNKIVFANLTTEISDMNSVTRNGLGLVRYYAKTAMIYKNNGTPFQPQLVLTLNISLYYNPYSCVTTSQYMYITTTGTNTLISVHNLTSGSVAFTTPFNITTYRPVIGLWNDTIFTLDQYIAIEYTLTGKYKRSWPYFSGPQIGCNCRHHIYHDYAGRRYTCNNKGPNPGIYAFLLNGTLLAQGPSCDRSFQVYITKEQATLINVPDSGGATTQAINFLTIFFVT